MAWVANNVIYTCICGSLSGWSVDYKHEVTCSVCGKKMKKSRCLHATIIRRHGLTKNDSTKGMCAKCGFYVNWVDEQDKSLYGN